MADPHSEARLRLERELYVRCLELAQTEDPAPLLEQTLALLRQAVSAERSYIELADLTPARERRWSADVGIDDGERQLIRERISRGVIAEAIETGRTVITPSAALDVRFAARESVRASQIAAVLCVPLAAQGITGVVYLQNPLHHAPFDDDDVRCAERVTRFVGSIAARLVELMRRREQDDATLDARSRLRMTGVIGRSPALAKFLERLAVVAPMEANVLFTGPSGTGKSVLARVLHDNSRRADGPFVELNCAALPSTLIESELFGAERGAHSGAAQRGTPGKVAAAAGGTLFLDEIGELEPHVQAKLLQFLQSKQYFRLGGNVAHQVDARIVAATNRDLETALGDGGFREDLYYRLRGVHLQVPSLAERRDDIPLLARQICDDTCHEERLAAVTLTPAACTALELADWPGNIRQLRNVCREGVLDAHIAGRATIEVGDLFARASEEGPESFQAACQRHERAFLAAELDRRDWNIAQTARELDMSRSHLNVLIRRHGLTRER